MRFIEVDLDGHSVRAQLHIDRAPKTAAAFWEALPFEGTAVHTYGSGEMIRMVERAPLTDVGIEAKTSFQHPGSVIYYPPEREIAISYGSARFAGGLEVCALGEVEGRLSDFAATSAGLRFRGSRRISFRHAADQTTPFRFPNYSGRKIDVQLGGVSARATLLDEFSPVAAADFAKHLPLIGQATNDMFGGQITRFSAEGGRMLDLRVSGQDRHDRAVIGLWPGFLYFYPEERSICLCYGDGLYIGGPWWTAVVVPLARLDGDWSAVRQEAGSQVTTGEKKFAITLA